MTIHDSSYDRFGSSVSAEDLRVGISASEGPSLRSVLDLLQLAGVAESQIECCELGPESKGQCDIGLVVIDGANGDVVKFRSLVSQVDFPLVVVDAEGGREPNWLLQGGDDYLSLYDLTPFLLAKSMLHAVERYTLRRDLRVQNLRLMRLIEANPDGILVVSLAGEVQFANPATSKLLNVPHEKLIGSQFGFPVVSGDYAEVELRHASDRLRTAELRVAEITWAGKDAHLVSLRDITSRKEAEAEAERYQQRVERLNAELARAEDRERQRQARVLHDDIQHLLVAARMTIDLAGRDLPDAELRDELQQAMGLVDRAVEGCRSLTSELTPTILEDLGLVPAVEWLCRLHRERYGVDARCLGDTELVSYDDGRRSFLFQATRELLFNSVKHARGARVSVTVERPTEGELRIAVADEGPGFDPTELNRADRDYGGYGLFHIRQRLEQLNGYMQIKSQMGEGTTITLTLPDPPLAKRADRPTQPASPAETIRVLLIDDSRSMRLLYTRLLDKEEGIDLVGTASTGEEGLRMVSRMRPDVVLTDITLPDISGFDVVKRLHRADPDLRIIGLSMHDPQDVEESLLAAGAAGYVCKGGAVGELVDLLRGQ